MKHSACQKLTCFVLLLLPIAQVCLSPLSQFFCNVDNPPDIYANMTLAGHCSLEDLVPPMQHMADLHDRFRRRLVYRFGAWRAEVLENFDVRSLMREVTLDGPDAQQAYHAYMAKVSSRRLGHTDSKQLSCSCPAVPQQQQQAAAAASALVRQP
jgi:hypothetical protein